jgi:hypothetical protein
MPNYSEMAASLRVEADRLLQERDKLQQQIERIITAIEAIGVLAQESDEPIMEPPPMLPDEERGFTDEVRAILKANPLRAFTAVDIRNMMVERTPHSDPKIILIHAHNTLKRLFRQGELDESSLNEGRTSYKWKVSTQSPEAVAKLNMRREELLEIIRRLDNEIKEMRMVRSRKIT